MITPLIEEEQKKRMPLPPYILMDAIQDNCHTDVGRYRVPRIARRNNSEKKKQMENTSQLEIPIGTKIYVTQWALSQGIQVSYSITPLDENKIIRLFYWGKYMYFYLGQNCFLTEEEARKDVENKR